MEGTDTYKTIETMTEDVLFKDKNSKFLGYAFPILTEDDAKLCLEKLKKKHHAARHCCYAYQLGTENIIYRVNDDGEPNNSAGMPIYGQIQSFNVTNILIIVVRYFGGIKLGVGGLINAYRSTAQLVLEQSTILEKTIDVNYLIGFDYKNINKVMRIIKEKNLNITNQTLELDCQISIAVRKKEASSIFDVFDQIPDINIKTI